MQIDHDFHYCEKIVKATSTLCGAAIAIGFAIYLFCFGPLSNHPIDRPLTIEVTEGFQGFIQAARPYDTITERFQVENARLTLELLLKTPRYIQVGIPITIRVKTGSLTIEKNERLSFTPVSPRLIIYVNPGCPIELPSEYSSLLIVPLKVVSETGRRLNFLVESSPEISTIYHVAGPKRFLFHIQLPHSHGAIGITWVEKISGELFEVESNSVSISLSLVTAGLILSLLGGPIILGELITCVYVLINSLRRSRNSKPH